MADHGIHGEFKKVFDFLSAINQTAYKNVYLLSNEVLSKNPFSNNFLRRFLNRENPELPDSLKVFSRLLTYYLKSFVYFGIYLSFFAVFYISRLRYAVNPHLRELILIDTFFLIDRIEDSGNYEDTYFVGLKEILEKLGKHYAYLPVFYTTKNPARLFKTFRLLKKNRIPVLTEYQLLSAGDLFRLFYFILKYPIDVLIFVRNIREDTYEAKLLKAELIDNLRFTTFLKFSRYLQGRKIASLVCEKIKLISWFENQTIDKNLYKGIREGENKIKIYGAQPFIFSKSILNILADENEAKFGVVPDRMVVSGSYFIPEDSALDFVVGPSFRYKKLFTAALDEKNRSNIVILLPYFAEDAENILNLLNKTKIPVRNIIVKAHPATPTERFKCIIPKGAKVSSADAYEIFRTAKIVIGAASGTLIEAVSLGIPVICIKGVQGFDYNPLLVYGKGIIWDEAVNTRDLERLLATFESALNNIDELDGIKKIASKYKNMFFCEPSDESIIKVYGLDC
ncbi:MAG: hypothetical protein A2W05_03020 [Candidatus Schekmanbacteria bacterium RBG_16_38_10]|uniref:Lipid-A-disaccharide synthase n=1 Tax=Candidatus Schekmanbacteria bacterium RBG_16_38_10 TaxID=1817879 RepID=A0A1F7RYF3_9BACT|nr:MAG: hypothetical protein A2W05_03020 [Candidatus Schekmanbacteria bacterium RBG_16_38_10]